MTNKHTLLTNGFILRPATLEDAPSVVEVLNASWLATFGAPGFTVEKINGEWHSPGFDPATRTRMIVAADGTAVAYADLFIRAPYVMAHSMVRVHPDWEGHGFGTILTEWCEATMREKIAQAPADALVQVGASVLNNHASAIELLTVYGYQHKRSFYTMRIEMSAPPPAPVWPNGISVRSMIPDQEEAAVYRVFQEAFRDHWGHIPTPFAEGFPRWLDYIHNVKDYDPALFFLAMDGNEIAGFSLCLPSITEDAQMGWVDDIGVRRPWRKLGIAEALLLHSFGEFYRRATHKVGLGVDASSLTGALRLYEKVGMSAWREWLAFRKELRPGVDLSTQSVE